MLPMSLTQVTTPYSQSGGLGPASMTTRDARQLSAPSPQQQQQQAPLQKRSSKTARAASALKSSVAYGGAALLSGVNAITPHFSGAVDIMVVEQPDKTYRSTPFYVRFGKYTHLRSKDRQVQIYVNGQLAPFQMHLGEYGQAYFTSDTPEVPEGDVDDEEQASLLAGMMSPPSGYSSGDDERPQYANQEVLASVQEEVRRMQEAGGDPSDALGTSFPGSDSATTGSAAASPPGSLPYVPHPTQSRSGAKPQLPLPPQALGAQQQHPLLLQPAHSSPPTQQLPLPPQALGGPGPRQSPSAPHRLPRPSSSNALGSSPVLSSQLLGGGGAAAAAAAAAAQQGVQVVAAPLLRHTLSSGSSSALGSSPLPPTHPLRTSSRHPASSVNSSSGMHGRSPTSPLGASPSKSIPGLEGLLTHHHNDSHPSSSTLGSYTLNSPATNRQTLQVLGFPDNKTDNETEVVHTTQVISRLSMLESLVPTTSTASEQQPDQFPPTSNGDTPHAHPNHPLPATSLLSISIRDSEHSQTPGCLSPAQEGPSNSYEPLPTHSNGPLSPAVAGTGPQSENNTLSPQVQRAQHSAFQSISPQLAEAISPTSPGPAANGLLLEGVNGVLGAAASPQGGLVLPPLDQQQQLDGQLVPAQLCLPPPNLLGALSSHLQGLELSLCGQHLQSTTRYAEAVQIFEDCRVGPEEWAEKGQEIIQSPHLMVRLQGELYPWTAAAPVVLGWAAFGAWWPHLLPPDTKCWAPPSGMTPNASGILVQPQADDAKKGSWRLWPFTTRKDRGPPSLQDGSRQLPPLPETSPGSTRSQPTTALTTLPADPLAPASSLSLTAVGNGSRAHLEHSASAGSIMQRASSSRSAGSGAGGGGGGERLKVQRSKSSMMARKTLSPTMEQLMGLRLRAGQNTIKYSVGGAELVAYVYFYHYTTRLVISDIDGTITKSDVLGHLLPAMGWDWSHAGIARLLTDIAHNCYQLMYLSSRSISQAGITRDYLNTLVQGEHRMPVGPVIISPHGLLPSLYREMILRRPHEFKIATLQDIRALFPSDRNPFYAGFGNRDTDEISYKEVGVPLGRTFIINPKGELRKASVTMQSSSLSTLAAVNQLIDEIFPPLTTTLPETAVPPDTPSAPPTPSRSLTTSLTAATAAAGAGTGAASPTASAAAAAGAAGVGELQGVGRISSGGAVMSSQKALLTALQDSTAEEYNDVQYWADDPMMAGGSVDELERFIMGGAGRRQPQQQQQPGGGPGGQKVQEGEEDGEERGSGLEAAESLDVVGVDGRSRDFITSFNPFAY